MAFKNAVIRCASRSHSLGLIEHCRQSTAQQVCRVSVEVACHARSTLTPHVSLEWSLPLDFTGHERKPVSPHIGLDLALSMTTQHSTFAVLRCTVHWSNNILIHINNSYTKRWSLRKTQKLQIYVNYGACNYKSSIQLQYDNNNQYSGWIVNHPGHD